MKDFDKFKILNIIDSIIRDLELELRFSQDEFFKKDCIDIISKLHSLRLGFILIKVKE